MAETKVSKTNRLAGENGKPSVLTAKATKKKGDVVLRITAPRMERLKLRILGTAPYMQLRFSAKAMQKMQANMEAGQTGRSKKAREPRDFDNDYQEAFHRLPDGSPGIPAAAFRAACISACRLVGYKMTIAKLSIFFECDGFDVVDGSPLIRIQGDPEMTILPARNANGGMDLRVRPMWREWSADVTMRFDRDQFDPQDVLNLLCRVGCQVGVGEGRADSRASVGLGFGSFDVQGI